MGIYIYIYIKQNGDTTRYSYKVVPSYKLVSTPSSLDMAMDQYL